MGSRPQKHLRKSAASNRFLLKDIALQAGVSLATIDRVLHERGQVREHTARRVYQAIEELDQQRTQIGLVGRKFIIDVVMNAPHRLWEPVRQAMSSELSYLHPAVFRVRYHLTEQSDEKALASTVASIVRQGSHGVIVNAADTPATVGEIDTLAAAGIPVITFTTDIPNSRRTAFVGMDNAMGGATAGYLIGQWLPEERASVLVTLRGVGFRGEEDREFGLRSVLRAEYPHLSVVDLNDGLGVDEPTGKLTAHALAHHKDILAVYSIGGGNRAICAAIEAAGCRPRVYIAHDLDDDNIKLMNAGRINAILHHDLRHDLREACLAIMRHHRAVPETRSVRLSNVQVVTPKNLPGFVL